MEVRVVPNFTAWGSHGGITKFAVGRVVSGSAILVFLSVFSFFPMFPIFPFISPPPLPSFHVVVDCSVCKYLQSVWRQNTWGPTVVGGGRVES